MIVKCPLCLKAHIELQEKGDFKMQSVPFECGINTVYFGWTGEKWVIASVIIPASTYYGAEGAAKALINKDAEVVDICQSCNEDEATIERDGVKLCNKCCGQMALTEIKDSLKE